MAVSRASTREHYLDAEIPQRNGPFGAAGYVADPAAGRATPTTLQQSALRRVSIVEVGGPWVALLNLPAMSSISESIEPRAIPVTDTLVRAPLGRRRSGTS